MSSSSQPRKASQTAPSRAINKAREQELARRAEWDEEHRRAQNPMTAIEKKPGYVRCEMAFPIRGYQLLSHPDSPALRVLAIETDDGPVALLMNKEVAETIGQALLRIAKQMLEKGDLS